MVACRAYRQSSSGSLDYPVSLDGSPLSCGRSMENLTPSASFHSGEKSAPSNPGSKHPASLGCVALARDLHGDGRIVHDLNEALGLVGPLRAEPARACARAEKALDGGHRS